MDFFDLFMTILVFLMAFIVVVALAYITTRLVAGAGFKKMKSRNIKVLESVMIAQGKYLQLVKAGTKYILISSSKDHTNLITMLDEKDLDLSHMESEKEISSFSDILNKLKASRK